MVKNTVKKTVKQTEAQRFDKWFNEIKLRAEKGYVSLNLSPKVIKDNKKNNIDYMIECANGEMCWRVDSMEVEEDKRYLAKGHEYVGNISNATKLYKFRFGGEFPTFVMIATKTGKIVSSKPEGWGSAEFIFKGKIEDFCKMFEVFVTPEPISIGRVKI